MKILHHVLLNTLSLILPVIAVAEYTAGSAGQQGNAPYQRTLSCSANELIVGMIIGQGTYVDGVQLICGNKSDLTNRRNGPRLFGGSASSNNESTVLCPDNSALFGLTTSFGTYVDRLHLLRCADPQDFAEVPGPVTPIVTPLGAQTQDYRCRLNNSELVSSIYVESGAWLDFLEVRCAKQSARSAQLRRPRTATETQPSATSRARQIDRAASSKRTQRPAPSQTNASRVQSAGNVGRGRNGTRNLSCRASEAIVGLKVTYANTIDALQLICAQKDDLTRTRIGPYIAGRNADSRRARSITSVCEGGILAGIRARAASDINRIESIDCHEPTNGRRNAVKVRVGSARGVKASLLCERGATVTRLRVAARNAVNYLEPFCRRDP